MHAAMMNWYAENETVGTSYVAISDPRHLYNPSQKVPLAGRLAQLVVARTGPATSMDIEVYWHYGGAGEILLYSESGITRDRHHVPLDFHWILASESVAEDLTLRVLTDDGTTMTTIQAWFGIEPVLPVIPVKLLQPWNDIRIIWEAQGGSGLNYSDVAPTVRVVRISDGKTLQSDDSWDAGAPDDLTMTLQSSWSPNYAYFDIPSAALDRVLGAQGYLVEVSHPSYGVVQTYHIDVKVSPWGEALSEYSSSGSFGDAVTRTLGLKNHNTRWVPSAWDSANRPTAGVIHAYDSASNYDADSAPYSGDKRYAVTATYDGDGKLTLYGCRLEA